MMLLVLAAGVDGVNLCSLWSVVCKCGMCGRSPGLRSDFMLADFETRAGLQSRFTNTRLIKLQKGIGDCNNSEID